MANPEKESKSIEKKKNVVQQKNGLIVVNSILGKLELFNEDLITNKNISMELKLGRQIQISSLLEAPGK
jgi:hypothetical protein